MTVEKIKMAKPIAELDGDEMTRVLWRMIKDQLILPFVELNTEYYDLGLKNRDETDDRVTTEAAQAIKKLGVGVKCATITPNKKRMEEYSLKRMYRSPNGTIRDILDGTTFRAPIIVKGVKPAVANWKKPITIARHSSADQYTAAEYRVPGPGTAKLSFTGEDGQVWEKEIHAFDGPGVIMGMYNRDGSIRNFARACFAYAIATRQDIWFSAKDTILKAYDGDFRDIMAETYEENRAEFDGAGLKYFYTLIDDAVARAMRSEGGFIWALKNYDGDVMSDMVSSAFGSLAMMTSVLCTPDGCFEYEAAHGTITKHYYRYLNGEQPSSNPTATIFAWAGALSKRGELDGNEALTRFGDRLKKAVIDTIEAGTMTGDLSALYDGRAETVSSADFLAAVRTRLE
jgi:isocitrate dehydrogenase